MRHLSQAVPKVASQAFARKYIMLGRLVTHWAEIVGADLAAKAQPVGTRYSKRDGKPFITLEVACASAEATVLSMRVSLMLEKINLMFGENWVSAIRFVPVSANAPAPRVRKTLKPLTESEKSYLSGVLETVADAELQARLKSLGQAILQERKS
jgi:hypothetical protein